MGKAPGEEFQEGDRVRLVGLKGRTDLNGNLGSIVEWDAAEERWKVAMDDGSGKMLRSCHLEIAEGPASKPTDPPEAPKTLGPNASVRIKGLKVRPELNGLQGVITTWDAFEESWSVRLHGPEATAQNLLGVVKNFREENLESSGVSESQSSAEPFVKAGLPLGSCVRISKLQQRPELNGKLGTVVGWDSQQDRCQVRLPDGTGLLLKACNLDLASIEPKMRVQVDGLQVRPDLNGSFGTVVEWDDREQRWKVLLDDGTGKLLKESNLRLAIDEEDAEDEDAGAEAEAFQQSQRWKPGARVRIKGLQVQKNLNGLCGSIVDWDTNEERWKVCLEDGSGKMLKEENLESWSPGERHFGPGVSPVASPTEGRKPKAGGEPASHRFNPQDRVRVVGLQTQAALNGCLGTIVEWEADQERWKVVLDDGSGKLFRPSNVEPLDDPGTAPGAPAPAAPAAAAAVQPKRQAPLSTTSRSISSGARVQVVGLQVRPDLNGRFGEVVEWDDREERWKVILEDGTGKLLKDSNLLLAEGNGSKGDPPSENGHWKQGDRVRIQGLQVEKNLNGLCGCIVEWDASQGRWKVRLDDGSGKLLKEANLESCGPGENLPSGPGRSSSKPTLPPRHFDPQDRVQVVGLQTQPSLNGCLGTILEWDADQERWKVLMDDGSGKLFRPNNLEPFRKERAAVPTPPSMDEAPRKREVLSQHRSIHPGARVRLRGLQQWQIKDQCGTIVDWDRADDKDRFQVRLDDGAGHSLRAINLEVLSDSVSSSSRVRVKGLRSQSDLNGQLGTVRRWDVTEERWQVMMDFGVTKMFRPINLEPAEPADGLEVPHPETGCDDRPNGRLERNPTRSYQLQAGSRVQVVDLKQQKERNGSKGSALEWVEQIERWKVVLDDGSSLLLRPAHMVAIGRGWDSTTAQTCE